MDMKNELLRNVENAGELESLYRKDKNAFTKAFNDVYDHISETGMAAFWRARLHSSGTELQWGRKDIVFVLVTCLIAGLVAKLPYLADWKDDAFFMRNFSFIVIPFVAAYFVFRNRLETQRTIILVVITCMAAIFINALPGTDKNDTLVLSCMHLPFFLWATSAFAYAGKGKVNGDKGLSYLKYNGELVVITTLLLIAGAILTGMTIGLFSLVGLDIEDLYFRNIAVFLLPAAPIIGSYLVQTNPQLVGKVSPVIARIFSPLVLLMLVIYLLTITYLGKDPYNDRDFLLVFNVLLIGVMALIFFSVAESSKEGTSAFEAWTLLLLSLVTLLVNVIALSAIIFRVWEWGVTPNRLAVLGSNLLMLTHLLLVTVKLYQLPSKKAEPEAAGKAIASYLPVYLIWSGIVCFLFPFLFGFK